MNILYLVPYVPNLIRVRPYNLISSLAAHGHKVTVLTLWNDESDQKDLEHLRSVASRVESAHLPRIRSMMNSLSALPTRAPLQSAYCWQPELARLLRSLTLEQNGQTSFDLIHVEHLRGARYGLFLKSAMRGLARLPIVWDSVDCITMLFRQAANQSRSLLGRWLARLELGRTEKYEGWLAGQFDRVLVTSQTDRNALLGLPSSRFTFPSITVIPNGVDLNYFSPDYNVPRSSAEIVISGKMSYHANVSMALYMANEIMPHIWNFRPDARLTIVGKDPPREIQALAKNPAITITGTVQDIRPYLQRATVAAVPITYGAGIQNKVLEAMAVATPVISTPQAISALSTAPGEDVLVAGSPAAFADEVLRLLDQPALQRRIGQGGRKYVEANHQWDTITSQLEEVYQEVVSSVTTSPHG